MRATVVYLILLALFTVSIGVGLLASDWPRWCHRLHWCAADWPRRR
jgi:hypothetical protein